MRYGIDGTAREQSEGEGVGEQTRAGRGQLGHRRTDGEREPENRQGGGAYQHVDEIG